MVTKTVKVEWVRDQVFLLRDRFDFPIVMSQPSGVNAADLLPLSVLGCSAWDIVSILQKQHQQITGVEVTAQSTQDSEPPWRFRKIAIHYTFTGHSLNKDTIQRAIDLTEGKYCSTYATLNGAVEMLTTFDIVSSDTARDAA